MASTIANTKTGIRKLNTKIYDDNGHFAVQLYATVVYDETADKITLNHGGWATPTTVSRINQALNYRRASGGVFIKKGEMFYFSGWTADNKKTGVVPFENGMVVISKVAARMVA